MPQLKHLKGLKELKGNKMKGISGNSSKSILKKHESNILNHDFSKFYNELMIHPHNLDDPEEILNVLEDFRHLESQSYESLKKEKKQECFSSEEIPVNKAFELIIRESLLKKIDLRAAESFRNFIFGYESAFTKHLTGEPITMHEDPESFCQAEILMLNYLINDPKKHAKLSSTIKKEAEFLFNTLVYDLGPKKLKESVETLRQEIMKKHDLVDDLGNKGHFHPENHITPNIKLFYEKSLKHIEFQMENTDFRIQQ